MYKKFFRGSLPDGIFKMDRYSDDDRTLICRISNGDEEAMKMLVHRYWPLVFRTSPRIVCDRHEAEDIRATDILRRKKFFPSYKKKQDETSRADGETSLEERLIASEEWKIFTEASEMLSPKQRIVFTLKEIEGLDTPAVTQIPGLDADSIKRILQRQQILPAAFREQGRSGLPVQ